MLKKIKLFFERRRLVKEMEQSYFDCSPMETASVRKWKEMRKDLIKLMNEQILFLKENLDR